MADKFYKIKEMSWGSEDPEKKVYPDLNGNNLLEGKELLGIEGQIKNFNVVDNTPVFDWFTMMSISEPGAYDWILLDVYGFAGDHTPMIRGWCISKKLKEIMEKFLIAEPFKFYPAKVMFQGQKYDYYIFQLAYNENDHTRFNKCTYQYIKRWPDRGYAEADLHINNKEEFKNNNALAGYSLITSKTVLDRYFDVFWTRGSMMTISEKLKDEIVKENITGLKIEEVDYMEFLFEDRVNN